MKRVYVITLLLTGFVISKNLVLAQPGALDPTFGTGGIVNTDIGPGDDEGYSVVMQPDGKILAAGASSTGTSFDYAIVRYMPDGSLDPTFGSGGAQTVAIGSGDDYGHAMVLQPDGKALVTGYYYNGTDYDFATVRFMNNGVPDPTFAGSGICTFPIGTMDDKCYSIALQPDGKILLAGYTHNGTDWDFALARLTPMGFFDTTFGVGGIVQHDLAGFEDVIRSVIVQPDGRILVGGWTDDGTDYNFAVARYNPDGSIDNSFDSNGWTSTDVTGANDQGFTMLQQPDGRILLAGASAVSIDQDFAVVRYNPDGSRDSTYDADGIVTTDFFGSNDLIYSIALQQDGKLLTAGVVHTGATNSDFGLTRYNTDGSLDNTFDSDGRVTTELGGVGDIGWGLTIQPDAKGVVVGSGGVAGVTLSTSRYFLCDSIATDLTQVGITLSANTPGIYQWVYCDSNYAIIPGENAQDFTPTVNGNYAVIINNGGCQDTTNCYAINSIGLNEVDANSIVVYPNPTDGPLMINSQIDWNDAVVVVSDVNGKVVRTIQGMNGTNIQMDLGNLPKGVYIINLRDKTNSITRQVIKK